MEYTVNKLAKLSGVSTRTLRYYDEIGILSPARVTEAKYRIYGEKEVDALQQILFFRELEFPLEKIKKLMEDTDFDRKQAFADHLISLHQKRRQIDTLIQNVEKSLSAVKGEIAMTDQEKFEGLKKTLIENNEAAYGKEIREKYGDEAVDKFNKAFKGVTMEQYEKGEQTWLEFETILQEAYATGDPSSELAKKAVDLHRQWLQVYNPNYSPDYHKGLGEMYVVDDRFRENYDKFGTGYTEFLREAINAHVDK